MYYLRAFPFIFLLFTFFGMVHSQGQTCRARFTVSNANQDSLVTFMPDSQMAFSGFDSLAWEFGDGNKQVRTTVAPFNYSYQGFGQYRVEMIIYDGACSDTAFTTIVIDPPLSACSTAFSFRHDDQRLGGVFRIGNYDLARNLIATSWDFGDGNGWKNFSGPSGQLRSAQHFYTIPDSNVEVCVAATYANTRGDTCTDTACRFIDIDSNRLDNCLPRYEAVQETYRPGDSLKVRFTNKSVIQLDTQTLKDARVIYTWLYRPRRFFGDEILAIDSLVYGQDTPLSPVLALQPGPIFEKRVQLSMRVLSKSGNTLCTNTFIDSTFQVVAPDTCNAFFDFFQRARDMVDFQPLDTSGRNRPIAYSWDFGDGASSNQAEPIHQFTNSGTFSVCLRTTTVYPGSSDTCRVRYCRDVTIAPPRKASLTIDLADSSGRALPSSYNDTLSGYAILARLEKDSSGADLFNAIDSLPMASNSDTARFRWKQSLDSGRYVLGVALDSTSPGYSDYFPTYYDQAMIWDSAQIINLRPGELERLTMALIAAPSGQGGGRISGQVQTGRLKKNPEGPMHIFAINMQTGMPVAHTQPGPTGAFVLRNLPNGQYEIHADRLGFTCQRASVAITDENQEVENVTVKVENTNNVVSVGPQVSPFTDPEVGQAYPNPARDQVYLPVQVRKQSALEVRLLDLSGRQLLQRTFQVASGTEILALDIPEGLEGTYLLDIQWELDQNTEPRPQLLQLR